MSVKIMITLYKFSEKPYSRQGLQKSLQKKIFVGGDMSKNDEEHYSRQDFQKGLGNT